MHDKRRAVVLLSTYRGRRYLSELLCSLREQDWPDCEIIARDDGSDDDTLAVLDAGASASAIRVMVGGNVGAKQSFHQLLAVAPRCEAVFFADQDDVWHRDKVSRAMHALVAASQDRPVLYCCSLQIVDAEAKALGTSPIWPRPPAFANALVENIATGCTVALNWPAVELLRSKPMPDAAIMHDWWAYLVVSAFGDVIYDPIPAIQYRIHGSNQVGLPIGRGSWLLAKLKRRVSGTGSLSKLVEQARAFDELFGRQIGAEERACLDQLLAIRSFAGRARFLLRPRVYRQFSSDQMALAVLIVMGAS